MKEQRKDAKGRILRVGEDQMPDGRYRYRYTDAAGRRRAVYSWRLVLADKTPAGMHRDDCLREKEDAIAADLRDEIDSYSAASLTLNDMFRRYMQTKAELRPGSLLHYECIYRNAIEDTLGKRRLRDVRYSDVAALYVRLRQERAYKPRTIESVHNVLHPVFAMAVRDGLLRRNPTENALNELRKGEDWVLERRHALTEEQQAAFVKFVASSPVYCRWMPLFTVMLGTGCRIGEVLGLRWENCDFDAQTIRIDHTVNYLPRSGGRCELHCAPTKTASAVRTIPMLSAVRDALLTQRRRQDADGRLRCERDGWSDYVFTNSVGNLHNPTTINQVIARISEAYNLQESCRAAGSGCDALLLPHFTAHNLRHTFCTRFCENESNVKIIQEIMGHGSVATTMNIYAEVSERRKQTAFFALDGKVKIA